MAWKFTVSIPNDIEVEVAAAFAEAYNYDQNHDGMTRKQFTYEKIKQYIRDIYRSQKVKTFKEGKEAVIQVADAETDAIEVTKSIIVI